MKVFKHILVILTCVLLLSGCVKDDITMEINKDKSIDFELKLLLSDKLMESENGQKAFSNLKNQATDLEAKGFSVVTKTEDGYSGYLITKKYKNIDDLSKGNGEEIDLNEFVSSSDQSKTFKVEKGFLKNIYTANFTFQYDENEINATYTSEIDNDEEVIDNAEDNTFIENNETTIPTVEAFASDDELGSLANLAQEMEIKYIVKLPYAAISNNAGKTSDENKTLIWNLTSASNNLIKIEYSFPIYNLTNIILIGSGCLALIIIIIVFISIKFKKKESTKETLIHTDYDSSIVGQIDEATMPQEEIPQGPVNHEYSIPEAPQVNVTESIVPQTPTMVGVNDNTNITPSATPITPQETLTSAQTTNSQLTELNQVENILNQ